MVKIERVRNFLKAIAKSIYLPSRYFDIKDEVLDKAMRIFQTDWSDGIQLKR